MPGRGSTKAGMGVAWAYVRSSKAPGQAAGGREGGKGFLSFRREDCVV